VRQSFARSGANRQTMPDSHGKWMPHTGVRFYESPYRAPAGLFDDDGVVGQFVAVRVVGFAKVLAQERGAVGDERVQAQDFEEVRGAFDSNPYVSSILKHIEDKSALGQELLDRLAPLL